ncbi:MAG: nickel pincer cofactor biosynthesis protein LarC [Candidatus Latescibacterota bacterium]
MRIAYFDCFSGISGDMVLGALVDCGLDPQRLREEVALLGLPQVRLEFARTARQGISAVCARVYIGEQAVSAEDEHHLEPQAHAAQGPHPHAPAGAAEPPVPPEGEARQAPVEGGHHHLEDILALIRGSGLHERVVEQSARIFTRLAEAEARVHGAEAGHVHLHEVGALDAVVDVVGAVAGLRLLGVKQVYSSPLRFGTGLARCAHGQYPVPVPGVLALCQGVPCEQTEVRAELVTPTGAAIITTLAAGYGAAPPCRLTAVGYGAGRRDLEEIPNLLRVRLGETAQPLQQDRLVVVECNIDDMSPEVYGYLFGLLLERGARDVYVTPVHMKKGRPASLLSVLADPERLDAVVSTVLAETTTIGVRYHVVERRKLPRHSATVVTRFGPVRVKVCRLEEGHRTTPEYDDCARLARQRQVPILDVYAAARAAADQLAGPITAQPEE